MTTTPLRTAPASRAERMTLAERVKYLRAVDSKRQRTGDAEPCEHGHYGCALIDGGACSAEVAALVPDAAP